MKLNWMAHLAAGTTTQICTSLHTLHTGKSSSVPIYLNPKVHTLITRLVKSLIRLIRDSSLIPCYTFIRHSRSIVIYIIKNSQRSLFPRTADCERMQLSCSSLQIYYITASLQECHVNCQRSNTTRDYQSIAISHCHTINSTTGLCFYNASFSFSIESKQHC